MIDQHNRIPEPQLIFGPFRFDSENGQLWQGDHVVSLRAKTSAVLSYLAHHPGRLIRKQELINNVWQDGYVTKIALRVCIREVRIALGETAAAPEYIKTHRQQGYSFIASVHRLSANCEESSHPAGMSSGMLLVGRETELGKLQHFLNKVAQGERQCVCVTGEAGIGKTTMLQAFLEQARTQPDVCIGLGQCVEQYGLGEAYRPVLEALTRMCGGPQGVKLIALLKQHAPIWLSQMPSLLSNTERQNLQAQMTETSQERMLRELADALEVITREYTLILVLEDLHWSDYATIELLAVLAWRSEPARLFILCSYRPLEIKINNHPLKNAKQELELHRQCVEIPLAFLTQSKVNDYMALRFPKTPSLFPLAQLVYQKTGGNALFMVNAVNALIDQGLIMQTNCGWVATVDEQTIAAFALNIPKELREMIEQQLEKLENDEQQILRVASVGGVDFTTAAVAAGIGKPLALIEEQFEALARRWPFVKMIELIEWPDGTLTSHYRFSHALYQNVTYEQLVTARQIRIHGLIGECLAQSYGEQASQIAAELSVHFIKARDFHRAIPYCHQAGTNALQRNAQCEASDFLSQGLELLSDLPVSPERNQQELELSLTYGPVLMNTLGFSAPKVKHLYERAHELCNLLEETPEIFHVFVGLWSYYLLLGELDTALSLGQEILEHARQSADSSFLLPAHQVMAASLQPMGKIAESLNHAQQGIAIYNPQQHHALAYLYAEDPGVSCHCQAILNMWTCGYADQAKTLSEKVRNLADQLNHSLSTIQALGFISVCHHYSRDLYQLEQDSEQIITLSEQQSFPFWLAAGHLLRGWVRVKHGEYDSGLAEIQQALSDTEATGAGLYRSYYLSIYADACCIAGQLETGLSAVGKALEYVSKSGERVNEAELYRLKGELLWKQEHSVPSIEFCFQKSIEIAQQQAAKFFELRATMDLSRLWQQQGKHQQAYRLLFKINDWFSEGFTTADLQDAKALLRELALTGPVLADNKIVFNA